MSYLLDNAGAEASARLTALAAMFDPGTIRHLEQRGVGPGWHCLEVGGGAGSIAAWLAGRVGPAGHVLVTDINPRHLEGLHLPNLEVRRHDIATDPLPPAAFDLIHVRLVLNQFREPGPVLDRLGAALKDGGWLICEEFDSDSMPPDPAINPGEVLLKTQLAIGRLMTSRGFDRRYGRRLPAQLQAMGLADVDAEARLFVVRGGSPGADLIRANCQQLRSALIDAGDVTSADIDQDLARLGDPQFMMPSSIMWAAWGRRAEIRHSQ